jgi:hypothetical protein
MFNIGDKVTFTNEYGVVFPGKTVTGIDNQKFGDSTEKRYFVTPTDCPWFSKKESLLKRVQA